MKLTSRTAIQTIIDTVKDDFSVTIDKDFAEKIRKYAGENVILWTSKRFTCVANDFLVDITNNRVKYFNAVYTAKEWAE